MTPEQIQKITIPVYEGIEQACSRVVGMLGDRAVAISTPTAYVIEGRLYETKTQLGTFTFWIGINGPRLFFITNHKGITDDEAARHFSFCFAGAEKVGWETNYQKMYGGVSIWSTCTTDRNRPLSAQCSDACPSGESVYELTEEGLFWVTDIAMMVQSWIRTCEREKLACHDIAPAPL